MTLAARTREAAAAHPFLVDALRAGVVNYAAAARFVDVEGETEAVATALRRYAEALPDYAPSSPSVRVTMQRGLGRVADDGVTADGSQNELLLRVNGVGYGPAGDGDRTAVLATGAVDAAFAAAALDRLALADVSVHAMGFDGDALVALVGRRAGADAIRAVEAAAGSVPDRPAADA
ncbi:DUF7523 family protein [Haloarchaeobius litoreus]|uniref:Uncharacterized protein n=1 Tax=Haloarchaeobius litoreus TaxID=755306 RepID=A0ABD6DH37_9EURY|nr:hypothetical protein [Haloarchaeobius litoreus]